MSWWERREVRTGQLVGPDYGRKRFERSDRADWFVVTAGACANCSSCQGYEISLHHCGRDGHRAPLWPVLSAATETEARQAMRALMLFARTLDLAERPFDREINGDPRIAAWLGTQGYVRKNHVCWWRGTAPEVASPG